MTLYTSKVVAQYLNLSERRVRQLRDEGTIREKRPGLYDLVDTMARYIKYIGAGSKADLNDERAKLSPGWSNLCVLRFISTSSLCWGLSSD